MKQGSDSKNIRGITAKSGVSLLLYVDNYKSCNEKAVENTTQLECEDMHSKRRQVIVSSR